MNELLFKIFEGVVMRFLIFISLFFICVHSNSSVQSDFLFVNSMWHKIMTNDLHKRISNLSTQAGGIEYVNIEDLKPRDNFTKPNRVHLMERFHSGQYYECDVLRFWGTQLNGGSNMSVHLQECINTQSFEDIQFKVKRPTGINGIIVYPTLEELNEYINGGEFYDWEETENGRRGYQWNHVSQIDIRVDALLYPLAEEYVRLSLEFEELNSNALLSGTYELTRWDRYWFNRNIKPLLEKMIVVWDLYHGDYEPY